MVKKTSGNIPERSRMLIFGVILLLLAIALFFYETRTQEQEASPTSIAPTISPETSLLVDNAVWYPSAPWSEPKKAELTTFYGDMTGESIEATVTSDSASLPHFEQVPALKEKGFLPDNNLAADGPGSSVWGYKKTENGKIQVITYSYRTQPTNSNPNEPVAFTCPCKITVTVFVSNPTPEIIK